MNAFLRLDLALAALLFSRYNDFIMCPRSRSLSLVTCHSSSSLAKSIRVESVYHQHGTFFFRRAPPPTPLPVTQPLQLLMQLPSSFVFFLRSLDLDLHLFCRFTVIT